MKSGSRSKFHFLILLPLLALALGATARAATVNFNYTLPAAARTSAGVYTAVSTPTLIRTLWSGKQQSGGLQTANWDGNMDDGTTAPAGTYTIKLLYNNVQYAWEGVIGNTSSVFVSTNGGTDTNLYSMRDMAFPGAGPYAFETMGYNESQRPAVYRIGVANPNTPVDFTPIDRAVTWGLAATDGTRAYLADINSGWDTDNNSFVAAYSTGGAQVAFAAGQSVTPVAGRNVAYAGVIDHYEEVTSTGDPAFVAVHAPTGLAVQQSGNVLAVAHGGLNWIALFDKTSGAALGTISVANPGRIAFASNGDLWAISGTSAERFDGSTLGQTNTPASAIGGFVSPLAIGVDPNTGDVMVADGGASQQVKRYSGAGVLEWTLGQPGGYSAANGPAVANDKFQFVWNYAYGLGDPFTFIAVQSDGSFWIDDGGDTRVMHFDASMNYLGKISSIPDNHLVCVDPNDPTRVFAEGYLEYRLDYTKTLNPGDPDPTFGGDGSWQLVNNWTAGNASFLSNQGALMNVTTLSSGATTRTVGFYYSGAPWFNYAIVALPPNGPLVTIYGNSNTQAKTNRIWMAPTGDLRTASVAGGVETFYSQPFHGFDGAGNPLWGASIVLATATANNGDPVTTSGWNLPWFTVPITASNEIVSFNAQAGTTTYQDYHLGAVPVGGSAWKFKTSVAANITYPDGQGTYPTQESFGGHNGNAVWTVDRNIVWNYDGQTGYYSNQYAHYYDDGLFIGQFGTSTATYLYNAAYGYANNYGDSTVVKGPNGDLYAFSGDEGEHSGVHVWQISGLNTIQEGSAAVTPGQGQTAVIAFTASNTPARPTGVHLR